MSDSTNPPPMSSRLLDLPLEVFQSILYEALIVRADKRSLMLKLVNHFFCDQGLPTAIIHGQLSRAPREQRARPWKPQARCIRRVAEHLTSSEPHTTKSYISSLCLLAAPNAEFIFSQDAYSETHFECHVKAAEIYMNHMSAIRTWGAPPDHRSLIFGDYTTLALQYGSQEMVEAVHFKRPNTRNTEDPINRISRCRAVWRASIFGRLEILHFCFNYRIEEKPWAFDPMRRYPPEGRYLERSLSTSSIAVWNYLMSLHKEYGLTPKPSQRIMHLSKCARRGWVDMAKHLLKSGTDPNVVLQDDETPMFYAAKHGHIEILKALLEYGACVIPGILAAAAETGHLDIVNLLLSLDAPIGGAVVAAAKGGYGDVVDILLERGADANESDYRLPALGYAVIQEHTRMFYRLRNYGAKLLEPSVRVICEEMARQKGVESMLELLQGA